MRTRAGRPGDLWIAVIGEPLLIIGAVLWWKRMPEVFSVAWVFYLYGVISVTGYAIIRLALLMHSNGKRFPSAIVWWIRSGVVMHGFIGPGLMLLGMALAMPVSGIAAGAYGCGAALELWIAFGPGGPVRAVRRHRHVRAPLGERR